MTEGEKQPVKRERGNLRRPEGEGGQRRERASGAWAGGPMGNIEESCEGGSNLVRAGEIFLGERSGAGRGDFFNSLLVGPRLTNPIRTSPPG